MKDEYELCKRNIKAVLSGEQKTTDLSLRISPSSAVAILIDLKAEEDGQMDTNGWQWDFWAPYEYEGKKFMLSGSGYYGALVFSVQEESNV